MKAIHFDGNTLHFLSDYPIPKSNESLIKVKLAGICGTDLEMLSGYMSYNGIPGHEFVGIVEESKNKDLIGKKIVGEINVGCGICASCTKGLERHCPNRTVLGISKRDGAFAEFLSLPENNLHVIPDSIGDEQAVLIEPLAAAFEIGEQVHIKPDWNVSIVGDGRLAQLIVPVLKLHCSNIICFGKHENKLQKLQKLGIKTKIGIESIDGNKSDLVVEATGNNSGFLDGMKLVKPRGTMILKSTLASKKDLDLTPAVVNEITLVGSRCGAFRPAINALATGTICVDDLIDSIYPLEKFQEAFESAKKTDTLKVLLKP